MGRKVRLPQVQVPSQAVGPCSLAGNPAGRPYFFLFFGLNVFEVAVLLVDLFWPRRSGFHDVGSGP